MSGRRAWRKAWPWLGAALAAGLLVYLALAVVIWRRAVEALDHPPARAADAALILGSRAYLRGKPNPCLTGRVDTGLALAQAGRVRQLVLSGGVDRRDQRIEAEVMAQHARAQGYTGALLLEPAATTTRLNLALSRPLMEAAGVRSVIVVSEPYHLWRAERLARASGFDGRFDVQYAAAPTRCWRRWGMLFRGALREPLAVVNNAFHGYLH